MGNNNYLVHYGVKGMKWKNHIYQSIVGGEYIYTADEVTNRAAEMKKQGYTNEQIHNQIRSEMADRRAQAQAKSAAAGAGNYSGATQRAQDKLKQEQAAKPANNTNTASKYDSELASAKAKSEANAAAKEKELEQKHAVYEKEKAERKEQKEKERAAQEAAAEAEKAEKEAKKNKKGSGGSKKKGSSKKETDADKKETDADKKKKQEEEIQKRVDEEVKKVLASMGLSSQAMSKDGEQKGELSDEQLNSLANSVMRGEMGNGSKRKAALGDYYQDVQRLVNKKMKEAEVAKGAKKPEKQKELKWTGNNKKIKHTVITGGNYLVHYGVLGQKKGLRRYQYPDGSLTPEGRKHYGIGPARYQNDDGTLTAKGIKKYTTVDRKTGKRVLNRKGRKFYSKFEKQATKAAIQDSARERREIIKRKNTLSDEEINNLSNRLAAENRLYEAYKSQSLFEQTKDKIAKSVVRIGSDQIASVAVGAATAAGQALINKTLENKLKGVTLNDYMDNYKVASQDTDYKSSVDKFKNALSNSQHQMDVKKSSYDDATKSRDAAKAEYESALAKNKADKDRILNALRGSEPTIDGTDRYYPTGNSKNGKIPQNNSVADTISIYAKKDAEARKKYEAAVNRYESARNAYEEARDAYSDAKSDYTFKVNQAKQLRDANYDRERSAAQERMEKDLANKRMSYDQFAKLVFPTPGKY